MILSKLAGVTLLISVAAGPTIEPDGADRATIVAAEERGGAGAHAIGDRVHRPHRRADPRFRKQAPHDELGDLIVASVPSCVGPVRAMIDAYDRFFGDGTGEAFFMGPYLDALPTAVSTLAVDRGD